ncbi:MAG: 30S ribosomal protein S6 [Phycisphaerales bacterium]
MRTVPTCNYESMIILGQSAAADLAGSVGHVKEIFTKHGGTIIALKKWGDRQFAYPIKKQKRGMYILCYFSAPTDKLGEIERAFNLSETVLRQLTVKADHLSLEEMQNADGQIDLTIEANLKAAIPSTPVPVPTGEPAAV